MPGVACWKSAAALLDVGSDCSAVVSSLGGEVKPSCPTVGYMLLTETLSEAPATPAGSPGYSSRSPFNPSKDPWSPGPE